jgi:predicted nucleic acid-binding Zn ribbon protein
MKEKLIVEERHEALKAKKLVENMQAELSRKNTAITGNQEIISQQANELRKLTSALKRMDEEAFAQRKEYDHIINERDILGMQLIRRNDELALLYEKLRVQRSALRAGEVQYSQKVDDIRILKIKIKDLVRENGLTKGSNFQIDELKREVLHLQRELLLEKTKVTALSEELENPMNVHRWRKLEGSDPATFELIQKIQTLQRRLISKTEEVVEKGLVIGEKDKMYSELKAILARQPGPEVAEQLNVYQNNLKTKTRQMKSMAAEVNMYQAQVNEYKYELERVSRELTEYKRKYFQQKRKDQMLREFEEDGQGGVLMSNTAPQVLHSQQLAAAKGSRVRFTGGGFAIK